MKRWMLAILLLCWWVPFTAAQEAEEDTDAEDPTEEIAAEQAEGSAVSGSSGDSDGIFFYGGYMLHNLSLDDGYGEFLKERYGVEQLTLQGYFLEGVFMIGPILGIGLELTQLQTEFEYNTLNDGSETGELELNQTIFKLYAFLWERDLVAVFGLGTSNVERDLAGFGDVNIVTTNLDDNTGKKKVSTDSTVLMTELRYRVFGDFVRAEVGLRWSSSSHDIDEGDARPAYNDRLTPTSTDFQVGGLGYFVSLGVEF